METYNGHVRTPADAIILFEACRVGLLPRVQRRLSEKERQQIKSGSVFVWDEREAGMRRWTDGKSWSASRVSGSFLTYREMEGKRGGSGFAPPAPAQKKPSSRASDGSKDSDEDGPDGYRYKPDGLMKQSFSITTSSGQHLHLISYYARSHPTASNLLQPSQDPALRHIRPPKNMYPESTVNEASAVPAVTRGPMQGSPYPTAAHPMGSPYNRPAPPPAGYMPAGGNWPPTPVGTPPYAYTYYPPGAHPPPPHGHSPFQYPHHAYPPPGYAHPHPGAAIYERAPPHMPNGALPPPPHHLANGHTPHPPHHPPPHYYHGQSPSLQYAAPQHGQPPPPPATAPLPNTSAPLAGPHLPIPTTSSAPPTIGAERRPSPPSHARESPEANGGAANGANGASMARMFPSVGALLNGTPADGGAAGGEVKSEHGSRAGSRSPNSGNTPRTARDIPGSKITSSGADLQAIRKLDKGFVSLK